MSELARLSRAPARRFRYLPQYLAFLISRLTGTRELNFTTISTLFAIAGGLAASIQTLQGVGRLLVGGADIHCVYHLGQQ